jgi:predicted Mrr-cat superfamily restriction endonuclease
MARHRAEETCNLWCVRAEFGRYADDFRTGGYAAIGWINDNDLSEVTSREQLQPLYRTAHPQDVSNVVIGQQVGQIARFLLEIKPADYVVTPGANTEELYYGQAAADPSYFFAASPDHCPYRHRRRVQWADKPIKRTEFSVPFQNTMRSSLTVFAIAQRDEFFAAIGKKELMAVPLQSIYDPYKVALEQILELDAKEFEFLVSHLLGALGFDGQEVVGKSGDGGVDATGELDVAGLAKIKIYVQAKRYKLGATVGATTVRQLRQAIPFGGQGAFITTASYQSAAKDIAVETGFPRIGLIDGRQLVDLLIEHWGKIPTEFQERLALKPGLVRV